MVHNADLGEAGRESQFQIQRVMAQTWVQSGDTLAAITLSGEQFPIFLLAPVRL